MLPQLLPQCDEVFLITALPMLSVGAGLFSGWPTRVVRAGLGLGHCQGLGGRLGAGHCSGCFLGGPPGLEGRLGAWPLLCPQPLHQLWPFDCLTVKIGLCRIFGDPTNVDLGMHSLETFQVGPLRLKIRGGKSDIDFPCLRQESKDLAWCGVCSEGTAGESQAEWPAGVLTGVSTVSPCESDRF